MSQASRGLFACLPLLLALPGCRGTITARPDPARSAPGIDARSAWGETEASGVALGLRVERSRIKAGASIPYWIMVANRSTQPQLVTLYSDIDDDSRTRVHARNLRSGAAYDQKAIGTRIRTTGGLHISLKLAPGEIAEHEGFPLTLGQEFVGTVELSASLRRSIGPPGPMHRSGVVQIELVP